MQKEPPKTRPSSTNKGASSTPPPPHMSALVQADCGVARCAAIIARRTLALPASVRRSSSSERWRNKRRASPGGSLRTSDLTEGARAMARR